MEIFTIHRESVVRASTVLDKAFNGPFVEGQTQIYTLDDVEPNVFRHLVGVISLTSFWFSAQKGCNSICLSCITAIFGQRYII